MLHNVYTTNLISFWEFTSDINTWPWEIVMTEHVWSGLCMHEVYHRIVTVQISEKDYINQVKQ